jgi:hypothetical protein
MPHTEQNTDPHRDFTSVDPKERILHRCHAKRVPPRVGGVITRPFLYGVCALVILTTLGDKARLRAQERSAVAGGATTADSALSATDPSPAGFQRLGNATLPGPFPANLNRLASAYGNLPQAFELNRGQAAADVQFLSRGKGYTLFLRGGEAVLSLQKPGVRSRKSVAPAFRPAHQGSADLAFRSAASPGLLRSTAAELETNLRTADPESGSALRERAPRNDARVPNPESPNHAVLRMRLVGANTVAKATGLDSLPCIV